MLTTTVLNETGYEESAFGFSLSYNSTKDRAKELFPKFAFKQDGENKFLESIYIWFYIIRKLVNHDTGGICSQEKPKGSPFRVV